MYPGLGMKKPLNMIETPIQPDIRKAPPRFRNSGKNWNVDIGRTLIETETMPQFVENAVLIQSRDYNKTIYGQHSHRDVVNRQFRPPLITRDDLLPLSRQPRKIVVPRVNPGTAQSSASYFSAKNEKQPETYSYISDRVKKGDARPTFFRPLTQIPDNQIPDLKVKVPTISVTSGTNPFPDYLGDSPFPERTIKYQNTFSLDAGKTLPSIQPQQQIFSDYEMSGYPTGLPKVYESENYVPEISVSSGKEFFSYTSLNDVTPVLLNEKKKQIPNVSISSGKNSTLTNGITPIQDIDTVSYITDKNKNIEQSSGFNTLFNKNIDNNDFNVDHYILENPSINVSTHSGINSDIRKPIEYSDVTNFITNKNINTEKSSGFSSQFFDNINFIDSGILPDDFIIDRPTIQVSAGNSLQYQQQNFVVDDNISLSHNKLGNLSISVNPNYNYQVDNTYVKNNKEVKKNPSVSKNTYQKFEVSNDNYRFTPSYKEKTKANSLRFGDENRTTRPKRNIEVLPIKLKAK